MSAEGEGMTDLPAGWFLRDVRRAKARVDQLARKAEEMTEMQSKPSLAEMIGAVQQAADHFQRMWDIVREEDLGFGPTDVENRETAAVLRAALDKLREHESVSVERDQLRADCIEACRLAEEAALECSSLRIECYTACAELADLQRTFDLQWKADQRAIKQWQEAHPGNDLVWPDRCNMVVWLLDQLDAAKATLDDEEASGQDSVDLIGRLRAELAEARAEIEQLKAHNSDLNALLPEMEPSAEERATTIRHLDSHSGTLQECIVRGLEIAYRDGAAAERARWMECALYDPLMEGPKFKGWNLSALNRLRAEVERALADEIEKLP